MGERFEVGQKVRVNTAFPNQDIAVDDVAVVLSDAGGAFGICCRVVRNGREYPFARCLLAPADPPSVGVPGPVTRSENQDYVNSSSYAAQQQMAAQQQGQDRRTEETKLADKLVEENRALKDELDKSRQLVDRLCRAPGEGGLRAGDLLGRMHTLAREKADLETQVAYLTRELVLAKARAKGQR